MINMIELSSNYQDLEKETIEKILKALIKYKIETDNFHSDLKLNNLWEILIDTLTSSNRNFTIPIPTQEVESRSSENKLTELNTDLKRIKNGTEIIYLPSPNYDIPPADKDLKHQPDLLPNNDSFLLSFKRFCNIKNNIESISYDAETHLRDDTLLQEAINDIIEDFKLIFIKYKMNPKLFIDIFYDKEISEWSTFNIIVKPLIENKEMKFFINLWRELSVCANNHFISLEKKYKEYISIIKDLKRNFSVSMDIFKNSIE